MGGISVAIQVLGGFQSEYVQGLYLIILGMAIIVPLAFRDTIILYILIWVSYAVPGFLNMSVGTREWRGVVTNLFFLSAMDLLGGFGSYVLDNYRRRELRSRIELEATTAKLQESNIKLKSLDELKTQFFANVNHELRTPLTLMLAPLGPMIDGNMGRVTGKNRDTLAMIRHNGLKLLKLINNLLDLTKLEEGKMRLKINSLEFVEYVNSLLGSVRPLADRKSIKLYFQHPSARRVRDHRSRAFREGRPQPAVQRHQVHARGRPDHGLSRGTGHGIDHPHRRGHRHRHSRQNMLDSIFDRFSQVDGSLSRAHEGTGIGLSLGQ